MFGYVNVNKNLLRVCDYNVFRGYYCGLCKQLGKSFNQLTRLGLSYDMTFLAILISSLEDKKTVFKSERCIVHPLSKRPVAYFDEGVKYSADISVILTYLKLLDDWQDEKKPVGLARIFYLQPYKKAAKKYNKQYKCIKENLSALSRLENSGCDNVDMAADCFGRLLQGIFDIHGDNPAVARLGYLTGRFIYIADAFHDISEDIKHGSYNPFVRRFGDKLDIDMLKTEVSAALTLLLSDIADAYNLIEIKKNKELLDNIIFLGMRSTVEAL